MKRKEKMKRMTVCLIYYILVAYDALARLPAAVSGNEHEGKTQTRRVLLESIVCKIS